MAALNRNIYALHNLRLPWYFLERNFYIFFSFLFFHQTTGLSLLQGGSYPAFFSDDLLQQITSGTQANEYVQDLTINNSRGIHKQSDAMCLARIRGHPVSAKLEGGKPDIHNQVAP